MKRWVGFLLCVALSFSVWLVHNLSRMYTDVVSVNISAMSDIDGYARNSVSTAVVTARCHCSGFKLLALKMGSDDRVRAVHIEPGDFNPREDDSFVVKDAALFKYVADIFGSGVTVESFVSSNISFRFATENNIKLPVVPVTSLAFRSQYCALGDMVISPDSVTVYGDPSRLSTLESIKTQPVTVRDIRGNINGVVKLDAPKGVRLSVDEISYSLDVTRYVEVTSTVGVMIKNVPNGKSVSVFPSSAEVVMRCVFPIDKDPFEDFELFVDYNDFVSSINGSCVIRSTELPGTVISCNFSPEACNCVENLSQE
ncbi:MAG: CdaR family protein [Bacteroidales bacterium]|nr:CdaR family protein [Bacteroidales bacterium]